MTWRLDCFGGVGVVRFGCKADGSAAVVDDLGFSSETSLLGRAEYSGGFGRFVGSPKVEVDAFERLGESKKTRHG